MKFIKKILSLAIICGIIYGLFGFHYIITDNGLKVLKKTSVTLQYTFVDARGAKMIKILLKPALIEAGINDIVEDITD